MRVPPAIPAHRGWRRQLKGGREERRSPSRPRCVPVRRGCAGDGRKGRRWSARVAAPSLVWPVEGVRGSPQTAMPWHCPPVRTPAHPEEAIRAMLLPFCFKCHPSDKGATCPVSSVPKTNTPMSRGCDSRQRIMSLLLVHVAIALSSLRTDESGKLPL